MSVQISLEKFSANLNLVEQYISECSSKDVTRIEYRTFDEGMCEANLFVIDKANIRDEFEAFVTLYSIQLHFYEEWMLSDINSDSVESILNVWMKPEIEKYSYVKLSPTQVHKEIDWIVDTIRNILTKNKNSEKTEENPSRWGVYVNDESVSIETTLNDLGIGEVISGVGFDLECNSVDIMYETTKSFVFFSWGTGA